MTSCCSTGIVSSCQDFAASSTKHVFCCHSWVGNAWLSRTRNRRFEGILRLEVWPTVPKIYSRRQAGNKLTTAFHTKLGMCISSGIGSSKYNCWSLINILSYMLQYFTILFPIKVAMVSSSILGETVVRCPGDGHWPIRKGLGRSGPWDDHWSGHLPRWLWLYTPDPSPKSVRWFPWHRWCGTWPPWLHVTGYMHHS